MKALTDYPTPETDAALIYDVKHSNDEGDSVYSDCIMSDLGRNLEQRLGACRELLNELNTSRYLGAVVYEEIRAVLTLTAPLAKLKP